jgi:iron complex outermembrane recepter protein
MTARRGRGTDDPPHLFGYAAGLIAAMAGWPAPAWAAPAPASEEIIVTAQKRAQALLDVPISMSALSAAQLTEAGVASTLDLARLSPGLAIGQNSGEGDFPFISLRGVAMRDFADTNESPSAVYLNGFYKANLMGLDSQAFDLARVEVLRGPQGTLYGRNATGGLIHFITQKPSRDVDGVAALTLGDRNRVRAEVAISGPLSKALSGRLSLLHHAFDGHAENAFPGGKDGNGLNASAVRGQLQFDPSATFSANLMLQYYRNDSDGNLFTHVAVRQDPLTGLSTRNRGGADAFGFGDSAPLQSNSNRAIFLTSEQLTAIATLAWDVQGMTFTAISGYESGFKDALFDSDATPGPRGTEVHPDATQVSQEARLSGRNGAVSWLAGLYLFRYEVDGWQRRQTSAAGPRPIVFYDIGSDSVAGFANLDMAITARLTATLGLRHTRETKDYSLANTDTGPVFNRATVGDRAQRADDATDFTARLSWKPTPDTLLYGGVARAHKAGTFNVGYTAIPIAAIPVRPEQLTSYEIGAKGDFADGGLRVSAAAFFYDYKDSQAFQFDGQTLSSTTFNRDAEISGAEVEISARPFDGLELIGSVTHLNAVLRDVQLPGLANNGPVRDTRMPLAPEWSANLSARYARPGPFGGRVTLYGDVSYKSDQFFDAFNSPSQFEKAYATSNLRAAWRNRAQDVTLALFAENVTNTAYRTAAFDLAFLGFATEVWARPRRIGASLTYKFAGR